MGNNSCDGGEPEESKEVARYTLFGHHPDGKDVRYKVANKQHFQRYGYYFVLCTTDPKRKRTFLRGARRATRSFYAHVAAGRLDHMLGDARIGAHHVARRR